MIYFTSKKTFIPIVFSLILMFILVVIPTGFEGALSFKNADKVKVLVLSTDESTIIDTGLIRSGEQRCYIRILNGKFAGHKTTAINRLNGSLAQDKLFATNEKAFAVVSHDKGKISTVFMIDHFRLDKELILVGLFLLALLLFTRSAGLRTILSFINTILLIWKFLVPCLLKGWNPIFISIGLVLLLNCIILSMIYGLDIRFLASVLGSISSILITMILGYFFTDLFKIHGAVMESSESLLYAGYQHLDLTKIFIASIFLGASGAVMDLSVDICSAVHEVVLKKPTITSKEAIASGFAVGTAACGSTTTTLLLAYSGSFISLLMVFMAQGTPIELMLNYKYVAAEIIHTIIGSFGIVTVAPLTAIISGILFTRINLQQPSQKK